MKRKDYPFISCLIAIAIFAFIAGATRSDFVCGVSILLSVFSVGLAMALWGLTKDVQ